MVKKKTGCTISKTYVDWHHRPVFGFNHTEKASGASTAMALKLAKAWGGGGSSAHIHQNNYPIKVTSDVPHVRRHDWSEVKPCSRWQSSPSGSPLQGKGLLTSASQHYKAAFYLSAAANAQQNKEFSLCFQNDVNPVNVWCVLVPRGMSPSDFTYGAIFSKMFALLNIFGFR